jgi:hypothetical protein
MDSVKIQSVDDVAVVQGGGMILPLAFCLSIGVLFSSLLLLYTPKKNIEKTIVSDGVRLHRDIVYFQIINANKEIVVQPELVTFRVRNPHSKRHLSFLERVKFSKN